jgi:murein DD-endopeptidase MepM/ murein hydrolase activator NlpD
VKRIALLALAAGAIAASIPVVRPAAERAWFIYTLATEGVPAHLPNPVDAAIARRLANSWGAARAGGRRHEGIDIFAPKGTPVVSTTRGIVTRVGMNRLGGRIVGVLGPGLEWHYYAHLDRFGTFGEGDIVQAGDVLGYVGNTGNARSTPSHLHYGVYRDGAKNPYPRLTSEASTNRRPVQGLGREAVQLGVRARSTSSE